MRTLLILTLIFTTTFSVYAQNKALETFPLKNNKIFYSGVVSVDSVDVTELHARAKNWIAEECEVVQINDEELLIGSGYLINDYDMYARIWFVIKVRLKGNRYKYEISKFIEKRIERDMPYEEKVIVTAKKLTYKGVQSKVNAIIARLNKAMQTPIDNNW